MRIKDKNIKKILQKYKEISLIGNISALAGWDLEVNMPPSAAESRAAVNSYLTKLSTDIWQSTEFKELIEKTDTRKLTQEEKAIVRNLKHAGKFYFKVPQEIIIEFSETTSKAFVAWRKAREENNFKEFEPHLRKIVKINKLVADYMGYKKHPYDALLDMYEPGLTTEKLDKIFSYLQKETVKILTSLKKSKKYKELNDPNSKYAKYLDDNLEYPKDDQQQISYFILRKIGYELDKGRIDEAPHPFSINISPSDNRITTRYKNHNFIESYTVALHEGGHAMYEQGVKEEYEYTPLDGGVSLGMHESQSRFWENQIGRSPLFLKIMTPVFQAFYPTQLADTGYETIKLLANKVSPGLIRVEADEVTYNLHIILRYEIEKDLLEGKIKTSDLPEIWNKGMKKYLGIIPDNNANGVLQDIHWSHGSFGYFPTYSLGNLYAAQLTNSLKKEIDFNSLVAEGELVTILSWFRSNIHQHGSLYWPGELIKRVTGKELYPKYFVDYLKEKYSEIYEVEL